MMTEASPADVPAVADMHDARMAPSFDPIFGDHDLLARSLLSY